MEENKVLSKEDMKTLIKDSDIKLVRIECEDTHGVSRGFTIDVDFFLNQLEEGIPITKSIYAFKVNRVDVIPDTGIMEEITYANAAMYPDITTFKVLPWEYQIASVLSDVRIENGNPNSSYLPVSPRAICKVQLNKLKSIGIRLYGSFEFEFYLLSKQTKLPLNNDENPFSTHSQTKFLPFVKEVFDAMKGMCMAPEVHHTECGPGQQEITCSPAFDILSPDNAFRFKQLVKEIASRFDYMATFMSKPFINQSGSSGHYNHSLWDENGQNVMYDSSKPYGLSEIAENWLAGLICHSNALMCLSALTPNCYERIKPGECLFAPVNNSWGFDNRTVTFRLKNKQSSKLYVENRMAGAAVNPYLLVAGSIIAGMDGIKRKLKLDTEPSMKDIFKTTDVPDNSKPLPTTLPSALECLLRDEVFVGELGPQFIKCFSASRRSECKMVDEARSTVDNIFNWYRNNYVEFI